jgi:carboxypeptidase family protein
MCTLAACVLWLVASAVAEKPTVRPEPVSPLTGTVTDAAGKPIVGALVLARSTRHASDPPLSARTDDAGRFRLTPASSGPMDVRVEAVHFSPQELKAQQPGKPLQVRLAAGAWIGGVVRDGGTKAPIEGARVQARVPGAGGPWEPKAGLVETTTDAQGRFRVDGLGPGRQVLRAAARGYAAQFETSTRPGASVSFFLAPGAGVVGRVRDGRDQPVAGAIVEVESTGRGMGFRAAGRPEETDANGRFELLGLEPGEYRLTARHREPAPAISTITLARGTVEQADLVLRPGVEVAGRLVDAEERPVPGSVALAEVDGQAAPSTVAEVSKSLAGDDGRFRMAHVPVGGHVLAVVAPGFAPQRVEVTVGTSPVDVGDVRLEPGLVIQGRVVDAGGTPVSEAELKAAPAVLERKMYDESPERTARSEGNGFFLIGGLGEGTYEVTVEAYAFGRVVKSINAGTKNVTLALEPGGSITGQVVDEGGRPLTHYRVVAQVKRSEDDRRGYQRPYSQVVTAEDGRFTIDNVAATTYLLDVSSAEYESASIDDVAVRSGAATGVGRVVQRVEGIVRGTVVDARDVPVAGAEVAAEPRSFLHFVPPPRTTTDGDGAFALRGVATGTVEVTVSHPSYAAGSTGRIEVDPARGPTEVRVVLGQGARVQGSVQKRDGSPVPEVTIVLNPVGPNARPRPTPYIADTGPGGSFAIEHVPPGQAMVVLMVDAGPVKTNLQAQTIDVREAQEATIDFVLRDIRISGVVSRQQAPIPNASVRFLAPGVGGVMMTGEGTAAALAALSPMRNMGVTGPDGRFELLLDGPGTYGVPDFTRYGPRRSRAFCRPPRPQP